MTRVARLSAPLAALLLLGLAATAPAAGERTIEVTAKKFEFNPSTITLKAGEPVVIRLTSLDRKHGFTAPDLNVDVTVEPGTPTLIHLHPDKPGTYVFHCSVFCGSGHEEMTGVIVVEP